MSRTPPSGWLLCPATVAAAGLRIELRSLRRLHRAAPAPAPAASRPAATPPLAFGGADSTIRAVAPSSGAMSRRRAPTRHALAHAPSAATSSWCCLRLWLPAAALHALAPAVAAAPSLSAAGTDSSCSGRYMLLRQLLPRGAACYGGGGIHCVGGRMTPTPSALATAPSAAPCGCAAALLGLPRLLLR